MNPAILWAFAKYAGIALALFFAYQAIDNNWETDAGIAKGKADQKKITDKVQGDFNTFVNRTKAEGEAAKAEAEKRTVAEQLDKEKKDANLKMLRGDLDSVVADLVRERGQRSRSGYLPTASAEASHPERATVNRAEFERAMGLIDERGAGIAAAGDRYRVGLDSLKP